MSPQNLKQTVIALSIVQAFALSAHAQSTQHLSEVVVTASRDGVTERARVGGFTDTPLLITPASVVSIGRAQMQDLGIRNTTDAMKLDASVSDSYNAVGYAEMFSIRGFMLDNASSYRKDGLAISGDTQIPLENKERIEILKGLAGLQAGVTTPAGIVNYVLKRPTATPLMSATVEVRDRGTVYGSVDMGGRSGDKRFGYRVNAAGERLRSYVRGADGERSFVSAALDWQVSPQLLLQLDMDYQSKSQITAPGYQLIRGVALPTGVSAKMLLNDQPWTKPVDTRTSNIGLRAEYQINSDWSASFGANKHNFKRDDFTAFPYGCSNEGAGFYPGYCSNGDYDVYDYQSENERKNPFATQAFLQGKFATGAIRHELTLVVTTLERSDYFGEYVYNYAGSSNIYRNVIVPPAEGNHKTGEILEQRSDRERAFVVQDILSLSPQFKLHAGMRYVQVERDQLVEISEPLPTKVLARTTDGNFTLPNVALVYNPNSDWTVYGSLSHGLEHGGVPGMGTENEGIGLAPSRSKQLEFGVKGIVGDGLTVSGALFEVKRGLEFEDSAGYLVNRGQQTHRGIELGAQGNVTRDLKFSVSMFAMHMQQQATGDATLDGKRSPNVPAFKSNVGLDYSVPVVAGLKVNGTWQYSGKKAFDNENATFVPSYHVFGLGAAYARRAVTLRFNVDNVTDKFYWRDVSPLLGGYLLPGAPRTARLSAQFDF